MFRYNVYACILISKHCGGDDGGYFSEIVGNAYFYFINTSYYNNSMVRLVDV